MIAGTYDQLTGAYITGFVYFKLPVDQILQVKFLVDTGAAHSFLSLVDLAELATKVQTQLQMAPSGGIRGIGGIASSVNTPVSIAFRHEDGDATLLGLDLALLVEPDSADLPSVLGRDVLFRGSLHFDPVAGEGYFDVPKGSFVI